MELIFASILAFTSTNTDDIFLLMLFFANKRFKSSQIFFGQLLGIVVLVVISLTVSLIGLVVDQEYTGLLGFMPIYLGVRGVLQLFTVHKNENAESANEIGESKKQVANVFIVSGVTIANGGDNVGIYVPLFATLLWSEKMVMTGIFLIMTVLWCMLARYFTNHPLVAKAVEQYGHIITPFVLILLGIYILYVSHTLNLIL